MPTMGAHPCLDSLWKWKPARNFNQDSVTEKDQEWDEIINAIGGYFKHADSFKCPSCDYQSGFGGRVVPTKAASFKQPQGAIEPSAFYDADGAAVI